MASEISAIIQLILAIIPILKPDEIAKIKSEIEKREKQIAEDRKKIIEAVALGDVEAINHLLFD